MYMCPIPNGFCDFAV